MYWAIEDVERLFEPLRELERMGRSLYQLTPRISQFPAINVWQGGDEVRVAVELPGIDPSVVDISVKGSSLTLKGGRRADELAEGEYYHRRERWNGEFERTVELPFEVDAGRVTAKYSRGILTIAAPRAEADKPRKIAITAE